MKLHSRLIQVSALSSEKTEGTKRPGHSKERPGGAFNAANESALTGNQLSVTIHARASQWERLAQPNAQER